MTMKLPQKAGFVATTAEWDALVQIAENLAAQVVQRDAAQREMQAERDAARAEVARLKEEVEGAYEAHNEAVTILERRLETHKEAEEAVLKALPAVAINEMEEVWGASNTAIVRKSLAYLWHCAARAALRQPAPAQADQLDDESMRLLDETIAALSRPIPAERECTCEHVMDGDDVAYTIRDRSCPMHTAPAGGEARQDASDNEIFGPAFAPRMVGGEARE